MSRIWRLPEEVRAQYDVSSLKTVWHWRRPVRAWLKEAWIDWLGPDVIMELYGGTEGKARTIITGSEWLAHRGSVGRVYGRRQDAGVRGRRQRSAGGETGEIYMSRAADMPSTYRYVGAAARTLPGGWESMGDIGWFDEEGYLYLADRRTDMILVGGANVYPAEIEAALDEHRWCSPAASSACRTRIWAIASTPSSSRAANLDEDLKRHLAERLVIYKRPRSFELVKEPLRDDAGKVRRSALREERMRPRK